jgi:hypothetical protein
MCEVRAFLAKRLVMCWNHGSPRASQAQGRFPQEETAKKNPIAGAFVTKFELRFSA